MKIEIIVERIDVYLRDGTDLVSVVVDKPYPFPALAKRKGGFGLRLQFETVQNQGVEYCQENFGVFPNIINTRV